MKGEIVLRLLEISQVEFAEAFVQNFAKASCYSLWKIDKRGSGLLAAPATAYDFKEWCRIHQGFFTKVPDDFSKWERCDNLNALRLFSPYSATYYVHKLPGELKIFPES